MTAMRVFFTSGLKLGADQIFVQLCAFLRNVMIARLISPADFGIAATFALTFYFLEMISNLATETLLVQADRGNDPDFQSAAHGLLAGRGLMNSLLIVLLAGPLADLFGVPGTRWAFRCVALVPLIKGFAHTDLFRLQREMKFEPAISVDVGTNLVTTCAAVLLGLWLRSYAVMVWVLVLQVICSTSGSHLVAERAYRWRWSWTDIACITRFGWPLLINGLLMFLILQGDRFVIGASRGMFARASYTLADLGIYSIAFSLTLMPTLLVANVSTSLFLPVLSRVQNVRLQFERRYLACAQAVAVAAGVLSVPFIMAGGWLVILIYGSEYAPAADFIGWLAAMQALRILRVAPTLAAMAFGDTKNAMVSNLVRSMAFVAVIAVAAYGGPLAWIAVCGFIGELAALMVCVWRLRHEHGIAVLPCLEPAALVAAGMIAAAAAVRAGLSGYGWQISFIASGVLVLALLSGILIVFPRLRQDVRSLVVRSDSSVASGSLHTGIKTL